MRFITGNNHKFEEAKKIFPELEKIEIDLVEIQSDNYLEILEYKAQEAQKTIFKDFFIEDSALEISTLNGFPGPFAKYFLKSLGVEGIWNLMKNFEDKSAKIISNILYIDERSQKHFFEGGTQGMIVEPKGNGWGYDNIFLPDGSDKTFGEMEDKNQFSHRGIALRKMKKFLD